MRKRLAFLGIPFTAHVSVATMQAASFGALDVDRRDARGLALSPFSNTVAGNCFNELWCQALNGESHPDPKQGYDWFAMLHSDVVPLTRFWLDVLIDELEANDADVIHAPVLIKDGRGLTSTAVGNLDDEWDWHRKLAVSELERLPETFGLTDVLKLWEADEPGSVGRTFAMKRVCLCPNTGCMVCKLGDWAWRFPGFEQRSRIVGISDGNGGVAPHQLSGRPVRRAELSSEDWRFGRWCAQNDLKVLGTNKVKTGHVGQMSWEIAAMRGNQARDDLFFQLQGLPRAVP